MVRNKLIKTLYRTGLYKLYAGKGVRFVTFHKIRSKKRFEAVIALLQKHFTIISYEEFCKGTYNSKKISLVLTFDDGYKSWMSNAVPVLLEKKIPAVFFINSGVLGEIDSIRGNVHVKFDDPLDKKDIEFLGNHFTIGGHTVRHIHMMKESLSVVKAEVETDKETLERITGKKMRIFAIPFGSCKHFSKKTLEIIRQAGYTHAASIVPGFNNEDDFLLHRDSLDPDYTDDELYIAWLSGAYDFRRFIPL